MTETWFSQLISACTVTDHYGGWSVETCPFRVSWPTRSHALTKITYLDSALHTRKITLMTQWRSNAESSTLRVVVHAPDFLTEIQTRDWAIVRSVLCSLICHKTNSYDIWRGRTVRCSSSADDTSRRQLDTAVEDLLHQLNKFRVGVATSLTFVHK